MVFELLTLRRLFPVWDVAEMRLVFEAGPVPSPSSLNPALPKEIDDVVMKALTVKAADRWQTAGDFEEALRTVIAKSGIAVTGSGLAREVQAIEDAAGPKAPKTQSPTPDSDTQAERPQTKPKTAPTAPTALTSTPQQPQGGPRTQPMPLPVAPAVVDADHSFVISLAGDNKEPPAQLAPLPMPPSTSAKEMASHPRTQVLAKNEQLAWTGNVGNDAELLALARAMGSAPGQGLRSAAIAAAVVGVVALVLVVGFGGELQAIAERALSGKQQELGVIIVKLRPTPEDVNLDGKSRGAGNKKIANVDVNQPHRLIVKPRNMDPIVQELTRADFKPADDGAPTFLLEKDFTPRPPE